MAKIYNIYDGYEYIGEMTVEEIQEMTGLSKKKILSSINAQFPIINNITAIYDGQVNLESNSNYNKKLLREFDAITKQLRSLLYEQ